ncbi:MAG: hypothetical protein ACFFAU_01610 [Candidatus Hodarchaeota archaeon]
MINRISINRCRYVVGTYDEVKEYAKSHKIPVKWIRLKRGKYYLRLWGRYKNVDRK